MKKIGLLLIIIFVLMNCSTEKEDHLGGDSEVLIIAPFEVDPPLFNIINAGSGASVNTAGLSQDRFRFEIIVESESRRIKYYYLSTNEVVSISLPSGIPLSFYVGLYYAVNSTSNEEEYNVYIASDSREDVILMAGETKELKFTLDLRSGLKVDAYFDSAFGSNNYGEVTGGVLGDGTVDTKPYFSIYPLSTSSPNQDTRVYRFDAPSFTYVDLAGFVETGRGLLSKVDYTPAAAAEEYWYIQSTGVHRSNDAGNTYSNGSEISVTNLDDYLENVDSCKSVAFENNTDLFYMLSYGQGYLAFDYGVTGAGWSGAGTVDFTYAASTYSNENFLLDMAKDRGTDDYAFFATKIGLFYVYKTTMAKLAIESTRDSGISEIRKLIRVKDPISGYSTLITRVALANNKIYLGTRRGLYFINQATGDWRSFANHSNTNYMIFPNEDIETVSEFTYFNEPIVSMSEENDVLMVGTTKRVWFKNLANGKTDMISVWDGIPFVPLTKYTNGPDVNTIDFYTHQVAPINFVLWDSTNRKYWIGTDFGLCAVNRSSLSLD